MITISDSNISSEIGIHLQHEFCEKIDCTFCIMCALGSDEGIYNLQARDISGEREVNFSTFRGKVLLVANMASECGYTDSGYKALQRMQASIGHISFENVLIKTLEKKSLHILDPTASTPTPREL